MHAVRRQGCNDTDPGMGWTADANAGVAGGPWETLMAIAKNSEKERPLANGRGSYVTPAAQPKLKFAKPSHPSLRQRRPWTGLTGRNRRLWAYPSRTKSLNE